MENPPEDVRWELLAANYHNLPPVVLSFPLIGALAVQLLGRHLGWRCQAWLAALTLASLLSLTLCYLFRRSRGRPYALWSWLRLLNSAWNGLTFGLAGVFLMVPGRADLQVYILVLLEGTAAAAVSSTSSHLPSLLVYLTLSLLPITVHLQSADQGLAGIARLVPIFWAVMFAIGIRSFRIQQRSALLAHQNSQLVKDLKSAQGELERVNQGLNKKVAERSLALSRFRTLLDASSEGILVAAASTGRILDWNQAAHRLLDFSAEKPPRLDEIVLLRGVPWPAQPLEGDQLHHQATLENPIEVSGIYRSFVGKLYLVLVLRDARRHLQLEQQLRASQKVELVGQMAGGIAHDFNNMLTVILGLAEYLRDSFEKDDPRFQDAQEILNTGDRASELTRKLLRLSRSKLERAEPVEINERLREIHPMLKHSLSRGVELVVLLSDSPQAVLVNPGDLDQLLLNLAVNAAEAMPEGGRFTVAVSEGPAPPGLPSATYVLLEVSDTGVGMSSEVSNQIFEPFFTTKGPRGHGLGLAVSRSIVIQAGGAMTVESRPGVGTTFRIWLPRIEASLPEPQKSLPKASPQAQGTWVLLVEDQDQLRHMMQRTLTLLGYQVVAARSSEEALTRVEEQSFELLFSDIVLPGMSGVELARRLQGRIPRVLMMSGYADEAPTLDGQPLPLLNKPFTHGQLLEVLEQVLGRVPNL